MNRRRFLMAIAAGGAGPVFAQPAKPVKIGMIYPRPLGLSRNYGEYVLESLAALGYRDGERMKLEFRAPETPAGDYSKIAREVAGLGCNLIFAIGPEATVRALQDARAAPILFIAVDYDPLEKGIVSNLRRPDRNTTGLYIPQNALVAKRFELLREILPRARNVLVMVDAHSRDQLKSAEATAEAGGVRITLVEFSKPPYDLAAAFETGRKAKVDGMVQLASPAMFERRKDFAALLSKHRMVAVGTTVGQADAGYLLSLGADAEKLARRVARMADRMLKGAQPESIPVEQAEEFELAINMTTAKALGVKIPESVLARATRIVQ